MFISLRYEAGMSAHHEVEDKYDVDAEAVLPNLVDLPGVTSVEAAAEHHLEATYFDSTDLALSRAGITLRRRSGGDDEGWHLKLPASDGKVEVQLPLGRAVKSAPKPLRRAVQAFVRGETLSPVAVVRTHRSVHRLVDDRGRALADLSDDRVSATDCVASTEIDWREWEVEAIDGDTSLLRAATDLLTDAGGIPSPASSKLSRALGHRMPSGPGGRQPAPRRKAPAARVVRARLAQQVTELRRHDPMVRTDVEDAVHKMRVAVRRLRNALATYRPFLDRGVTDPLRDELKWLAAALGEARDAEVLHERLLEMLADEAPELVRGAVRTQVDRSLEDQRRQAQARAVAAMETDRYFALLDRLDDLVEDPPWTEPAQERASDVLPGRVRHDWRRLKRRVRSAAAADDPAERVHRLHEVRKAAKRARYAAEPLTDLYGKDARRFVRATKRIQSALGDHHDGVVTQHELRRFADRAAGDGENAFTFGVLHAREEETTEKAEAKFAKAWDTASRSKLRRWLH